MISYYHFSKEGLFGEINYVGKLFIIDISIMKYMKKYIKPLSNINNITCG